MSCHGARRRPWAPLLLFALLLCGCMFFECGGLNPNCKKACAEKGECGRRTYKAGDAFARCFVRDSEDCAQSQACKNEGRCHYYDGLGGGSCVVLTDLDCRASRGCAEAGKCSLGANGRCIVEPTGCQRSEACTSEGRCVYEAGGRCVKGPADCEQACRLEGACTLEDGLCRASSEEDCRRSHGCGHFGQCTLVDDRCAARKASDCEASQMCAYNDWCTPVKGGDGCYDGRTECGQLCWERGDCARIDGTCQPRDESSCEASVACAVQGRCSVAGRPAVMCGADETTDCEQSLECKAFGRCTARGIVCVDDRGGTPSSVTGCLRDPECASHGRCLTRQGDGACVTAREAGLPDWTPPPVIP